MRESETPNSQTQGNSEHAVQSTVSQSVKGSVIESWTEMKKWMKKQHMVFSSSASRDSYNCQMTLQSNVLSRKHFDLPHAYCSICHSKSTFKNSYLCIFYNISHRNYILQEVSFFMYWQHLYTITLFHSDFIFQFLYKL